MNEEPLPEEEAAGDFFKAAWLFYLVLAVAGLIWLGVQRGQLDLAFFLNLETWPRDIGFGLIAGTGLIFLWRLGRRFAAGMRELENLIAQAIGPVDRDQTIVLAIISGFAEELFFRGAMQQSWGPWVTTTIFALVHTSRGKAYRWWTLFALLAGGLFAALTHVTGNLTAAIVGHVLVNGVNLRFLLEKRAAEEA